MATHAGEVPWNLSKIMIVTNYLLEFALHALVESISVCFSCVATIRLNLASFFGWTVL